MRILVLSNAAWPVIGGIEVLLDRLLPALQTRGHDVTLLTTAQRDAQEEVGVRNGVTVHRSMMSVAVLRRDPALLLRERQRIKRLVAEIQPDVIHAHDPGPVLWGVLKAEPSAPLIVTMHIGIETAVLGDALPFAPLLRKASWITAVSQTGHDEVLRLVPELTGRSSIIENGIEIPELASISPVPGRILSIGRLVPNKCVDLVIRALARLADAHPDAHLVVAGDGVALPSLRELATDLGIEDRVDFRGLVPHDQVPRLFDEAQLVAMPSRFEGQPLVALEAGAAARPMLATAVDGLGVVIADGVTGVLVPVDDLDAVTVSLGRMLDDPAWCAALGVNARSRVQAHWGFERCVDEYEALYRMIATPLH